MRKTLLIGTLIFLVVCSALAKDKEKDKDYLAAKLVQVKTQDLQSANYGVTDNRDSPIDASSSKAGMGPGMSSAGGSFSSAPTHFIRYNVVIETETELILVSRDREITFNQPDLKVNTEVKWKQTSPKSVSLIDGKGKKFDMQIVKRVKKDAPAEVLAPANTTKP